jgi:single-stranded DNA-binding protein
LSDTSYAVVAGIIQFPVEEKETSAGGLREAVIKTFTSQKLIKIVFWDNDWSEIAFDKGDTLFVDGKYEVSLGQANDGSEREYIQVTAKDVGIVPAVVKAERTDTPAAGRSTASTDTPNF